MDQTIQTILEQADIYGLRSEVRAEAMAILRENPTLATGSAILWLLMSGIYCEF